MQTIKDSSKMGTENSMRTSNIMRKAVKAGIALAFACSLTPAAVAHAKTLDEYDAEIAAQEAVVKEKTAISEEATAVLGEATNWYYKNVSPGDVVDLIMNDEGIGDAIDKLSYMDKIYATYAQKKYEAEVAKQEAEAAQAELQALKDEKKARARTLATAADVQFPQSNNQPWSNIGYWNGTIASSGCGVCAYTVVIDVLCGKDYTPADMMEIRGDWRGMDGYPDDSTGSHGKTHSEFTRDTFDVSTWNISPNVEELKSALTEQETAAIVCSRGRAFKDNQGSWRWSSGHFVAVLGYDDEGFHVSDSAYSHEYGTDVVYSDREMATMLSGANLVTIYSN